MSDIWEFDKGDVLAKPGDTEKYVVVFCSREFPNRQSYGLARVLKHPHSTLALHAWYDKEGVEEQFVKVERFDFELEAEVGDAEKD